MRAPYTLACAHDAAVQMIKTFIVRFYQHAGASQGTDANR
jgi:hypothetical protein